MKKQIIAVVGLLVLRGNAAAKQLFVEAFDYPDGLITNEYAFWNPSDPAAVKSDTWSLDSGSFYAAGGAGWTGVPDAAGASPDSSRGNGSAIFRLTTVRSDFTDVSVSFRLLNKGLSSTARTPPMDWDGAHIFLRYQSEYHLYYASINRRDNTILIKKKIPGGPSNGGTYYTLCPDQPYAVPYNKWQNIRAAVQNNADGTVTIRLYAEGVLMASATDTGAVGGAPIRAPGKVGLRGDNADLRFADFRVESLE